MGNTGSIAEIAPSGMKLTVIKVIKRKALGEITRIHPTKRLRVRAATVTTTVNVWISEFRKQKLEDDNSCRETIAGWAAGSNA